MRQKIRLLNYDDAREEFQKQVLEELQLEERMTADEILQAAAVILARSDCSDPPAAIAEAAAEIYMTRLDDLVNASVLEVLTVWISELDLCVFLRGSDNPETAAAPHIEFMVNSDLNSLIRLPLESLLLEHAEPEDLPGLASALRRLADRIEGKPDRRQRFTYSEPPAPGDVETVCALVRSTLESFEPEVSVRNYFRSHYGSFGHKDRMEIIGRQIVVSGGVLEDQP
jgi:hypothetical protein